jgi:hypothetical protein
MAINVLHPAVGQVFKEPAVTISKKSGLIKLNKTAIQKIAIKCGDDISLGFDDDGWYLITGKAAKETFKLRNENNKGAGFNSAMIVSMVYEWYANEHNLIKSDVEAIKTLRFKLLNEPVEPGIYGLADCIAVTPRKYNRK